jgi:cyclopropane-fatty-acyl-phospholipid synthase
MYREAFLQLLDKYVSNARIRFNLQQESFFVGAQAEGQSRESPDVVIRVHHERFFSRVLSYGNLGMGEAYMDRDFEIEHGSLHSFLTILLRSRLDQRVKTDLHLLPKIAAIRLTNFLRGKRQNVRYHYDQGDDLFEAFLDPTLTYSCGYARTPEDDLEQLQRNKLDRICQKLDLRTGDRLLDIGCGYGGLLIHAAKNYGVVGTGVTLSTRHHKRGMENIARENLSKHIAIELKDYQFVNGVFDKVASVGMMEHLPRREYKRYIATIARVLTPRGRALIHTIGCNDSRNEHDPFIQKYIFPGSAQPKLSEIAFQLERHRLLIVDVENIVRHYALTAHGWLQRFRQNQARLDATRYDPSFRRMWEYYLCCGIAAASVSNSAVYQVLFTKDPAAPLPFCRV